ncbi:MAG: hypothetical protein EOP86_06195 [Verrucomicrobiaceae bacterium]|nr:MAG: hypothetical protein EOP86_06195 [Verrucomicrobiaceae bacterium]
MRLCQASQRRHGSKSCGAYASFRSFAFCFGLIHGFGFANVLQETELPRHAPGCFLSAFDTGVEIRQACVVPAVAPLWR